MNPSDLPTFPHTLAAGSPTAQVPAGTLLDVTFVASDLASAVDLASGLDVAPDLEIEQEDELFATFKRRRRDAIEARGIFSPRTERTGEPRSQPRAPAPASAPLCPLRDLPPEGLAAMRRILDEHSLCTLYVERAPAINGPPVLRVATPLWESSFWVGLGWRAPVEPDVSERAKAMGRRKTRKGR